MARGRVITTLRDRPAIVAAFEAIARVRTEAEGRPLLQELAKYGPAVLPVLLQYLGTSDPWTVRALGRALAQVGERALVVDALRRAVLDPDAADRRRVVAMVLLDQYLQHPLDENLFTALGSPSEVAVAALSRDTPAAERLARLDYLSILHVQQPADIAGALVRFREEGSDGALGALSFFALDERPEIALAALEALGSVRRPAALRALRVLDPSVSAALRPILERMRRKLQLSGVAEEPLPPLPPGARVLVSPMDGQGNRLLIFLIPREEGGDRGIHLFLDDDAGVGGAYEVVYGPGDVAQPSRMGTVHPAPHPWKGVRLLEATWGYGQRLLWEALRLRDAELTDLPLEYRFFIDQVWGVFAPAEAPPRGVAVSEVDGEAIEALLSTPYAASWYLDGEAVYHVAAELLAEGSGQDVGDGAWDWARTLLLEAECTEEWCLRFAGRLRDLAEWLVRAHEDPWSGTAQAAAEELERRGSRSAFAEAIVRKSLTLAVRDLGYRQEKRDQRHRS